MYEQFVRDPDSVGDQWQEFFADYKATAPSVAAAAASSPAVRAVAAAHRAPAEADEELPAPPPDARAAASNGTGAERPEARSRAEACRRARGRQADPWRRRGDRAQHGGEPRGSDRHQLPQRAGEAARGEPQGHQRVPRPLGPGQDQLHAPDRVGGRAGDRRCGPGDEERLPGRRRRQAPARRQRSRQHGARRRCREEGRQSHAAHADHPRCRHARLRRFPRVVRRTDPQGEEQQADRRGLHGRERVAHEPRHDRHGAVGPTADAGPGSDRRCRLDRLPGRVRGSRPIEPRRHGPEQDGHGHLHLRPPHHPGRRIGSVPQAGQGVAARRARVLRRHLPQPRPARTRR